MAASIKDNFQYYLANQGALVEKYVGRFIAIADLQVVGAYDNQLAAIEATEKQGHERGTFLIQKVESGTAAHTQTFHSRVAFA